MPEQDRANALLQQGIERAKSGEIDEALRLFEQALEVVPPSITDDTVKYYEQLGRQLMKRGRDSGRRSEDDLYT